MLDIYDYIAGWAIYIGAGALCFVIFYRFTGLIRIKTIANALRALMIALMFTPWYVSPDENLLAPALIVILLDMVTVGGTSFVRALVPLLMTMMLALFLSLAGSLFKKFNRR